jgi:hypothetical protein
MADIEDEMGAQLDATDRASLRSGDTRWRNRAQWARLDLVNRGLLDGNSKRGIWTIADAGRHYLAANR